MAPMAHSLMLPSVGASPAGRLNGGAKSKRRAGARVAFVGRRNVQASLCITPFQSFSGMRKASVMDSLTVKQGKDFKSVVANSTALSKRSGALRAVTTAMFERFTEKAIKVIMLAQEEARQLGHNYIGTEHLLLGLLREGEGVAARVLENLGADPSNIRTQVECARQGSEESSRESLTMAMAVACPVALALILPHDASAMASGEVLRLSAAEIDPSIAKLAITIMGPLFAAFNLLFIVRIVMSWYPQIPVGKFPFSVAYAPTELVLGPTRRLIPPVGGVDVAPVIWVALMSFLNEILLGQQGLLVLLSQQQP